MKFDELFHVLIESPYPIDDLGSRNTPDSALNRNVAKSLSYGTVNIFGKDLEVRRHTPTQGWEKYYFYDDGEVVAFYSGLIERKNKIVTSMTMTRAGYVKGKSLMGEIYTEFLLKHYDSVVSDSALTEKGFNFWKNNFSNFIKKGFKVNLVEYSMHTNEFVFIENLKSIKDLQEFYTAGSSNYRFEVSKY